MQYNILCTVKRFEAYETIGGLFSEVTGETLELSVTDKIWALMLDTILFFADRYSADASEMISDLINEVPSIHLLKNMNNYKRVS